MFNFRRKGHSKEKIFCVGLGKTGTTTLEQVFKDLGFKVGDQRTGENLIGDWAKRDFKKIIKLTHSADAFQDTPFSLPYTFIVLDQYFPNAKFILSVRDSAEEWYDSLTRFHSRIWADGNRVPTREDLKSATYIYKGRPFDANRLQFQTPESDPYQKEWLLSYYKRHIANVQDYFRHRPEKLITINVKDQDDFTRLCDFLGKVKPYEEFPWLNKT
jgi:hypothetical protein